MIPIYNRLGAVTVSYKEVDDFFGPGVIENLPEWDVYPELAKHKDAIINLFHIRYDCREIGYDMPYKFIERLKYKFYELGPRYNLAYQLYNTKQAEIEKIGRVTIVNSNGNRTLSINDKVTNSNNSKSNYYDTPKVNPPSSLVNPSNSTVGEDSGNSIRDNTTTDTSTTDATTTETDQYLEQMNRIIDAYRSLDVQFVNDLEDLFLQVKILE